MIEVEKKAWIKDKEIILNQLEAKAQFKKSIIKEDIYYINRFDKKNTSHLSTKDKIFRVRSAEDKIIVTFKEKTFSNDAEVNFEEEFEIHDKKAFEDFTRYIGFDKLIEKVKELRLYHYQGVTVEYAYLHNLGYFLECEVLCDKQDEVEKAIIKIDQVLHDFGIPKNDIETKMYIELLLDKKVK